MPFSSANHAPHPLLYEINTRCWLRELSEGHHALVTLANVPATAFEGWQKRGFTHVWLMGVWSIGPRGREFSRRHPDVRREAAELLPDVRDEDIAGSPYAVAGYEVSPALGGAEGLKVFRERLAACGIKLLLDFVPNHTGLDHPWLTQQPAIFVHGARPVGGTFRQETVAGLRWIAHGRDPYFPPWADTAQIDYRTPAARAAMIGTLHSIAAQCDGVRCDMAMLALNEVFARTWADWPPPTPPTAREFWAEAIAAVRQRSPRFLFLAEAYWDLEARLQALGFDYTYDKRLYDHLVAGRASEAGQHLLGAPAEFVAHSAHFLENHDEPRIASRLAPAPHRAAALLTLGLPGMRFLHEGQLAGAARKVSVHLGRRPQETVDGLLAEYYERLLATLGATSVGRGDAQLLRPQPAWAGNPTASNFALVQWQSLPPAFDLVVVNLAPHRGQCYAPLNIEALTRHHWEMSDLLGDETHERDGVALAQRGLYLDVPAHGAQLFRFRPAD